MHRTSRSIIRTCLRGAVAVAFVGGAILTQSTNAQVFAPGGTHLTVAGTGGTGFGNGGFDGDGGPATDASLNGPAGLHVSADGTLYISDTQNHRVRMVDAGTGAITTIAGTGTSDAFAGAGGAASDADIPFPGSIVADADGNVYFSTSGRVVKIDTDGVLTVVAGTGAEGFSGDDGPATDADLHFPSGVALDADGNLYIADTNNHRVRKVDTASGVISTFAGDGATADEFGTGTFGGDGGAATDASLNRPAAIAFDSSGNLFIVDRENNRVRKVDTSGNIETFAGNGEFAFSGDGGPATDAAIASPFGVSVDGSGNVFITDTQNQRVRMVTDDGTIVTAAGSGEGGFAAAGFDGDSGNGLEAMFNFPITAATDAVGNLYVADQNNHRIRKVSPGDGTSGGGDGTTGGGDDGTTGGDDGTTGGDDGSTVVLPQGEVGPVGLGLDPTFGDQGVRQTETNPEPGDIITVDVFVTAGADDVAGFEISLQWDPMELNYVSFAPADIFAGAAPIPTITDSTATLSNALLGFGLSASADAGTAGQATFQVADTYSGDPTTITLTDAKLGADPVEVGPGAAFVVIGGATEVELTVTEKANFDGDPTVGFGDFLIFAGGFGKTSTDGEFDARLDLDGDGTVGFGDFLLFAGVFGQTI